MEVLFHFVFELVKIAILGCFYATLTLVLFATLAYYQPRSLADKVSQKPSRLWWVSGLIISVALFFFMFTYWGNHGLGDIARIPIGNFKTVGQINGTSTYIEKDNGKSVGVESFAVNDNKLFAELDDYSEKGSYVIWNLETDKWYFYQTRNEYLKLAKRKNYPLPDTFKDFQQHYSDYWHGWRFFLLP
ncbi:MAG: hypothetical protein V4642_12070 [Bacteroidota bacterium]